MNLQRIIDVCEKANPNIQYNLEMITRDPLKVPCLTDPYWVTFGELPGRELARRLASVKRNQSKARCRG